MTTKKDIFARYLNQYLQGNKQRKGEILDHVCDVVTMHRKAVIRKFRALQMRDPALPPKRGRKTYYTADCVYALKTVWETASEICGELLHSIIVEYVEILQRDKMWQHGNEATKKLLEMSEATVKRRVGGFMKVRKPRGLSSTKPSHLKEIIPIFIGPWEDKPPGYGQIDTLVHCGISLAGDMAYSVNYTDVAVLWVSLSAQWNKGQRATQKSLSRIKEKVPFKILGMHPDTGSEFINYVVKDWCDDENIELTRSRPYHKNDNAYVEQKNGHVIRRFLGYTRLDNREIIEIMNEMYDKLELYLNHFVSSRKCIEKVRIGSKYKRKYDKAKTPYKRVLEHPAIERSVKQKLIKEHKKLNPLILKREIDKLITKVFEVQKTTANLVFEEDLSKSPSVTVSNEL
ncbi:MAG: transposase family protein [Parcubacteria group bacterium]|nr:transposase family protein [Parcubacteria group bacterium]